MDQPSFIDPARIANLPEVPETERAWAAGFFDGEGHCGAYRGSVHLNVNQTETSTLRRFHEAVGEIGRLHHTTPDNPNWSQRWDLQIRARREVDQAVATLWPWLSEPKRRQITRSYDSRALVEARRRPGFAHSSQKLTDDQAAEIKALLDAGGRSQASIAKDYGVTQTVVSAINLGRRRGAAARRSGRKPRGENQWPVLGDAPIEPLDVLHIPSADGPTLTLTELAWAAGFFDAEGHARISEGKYLSLAVTQTETSTLERFSRAVGGLGRIYERSRNQPAHWTPGYVLLVSPYDDWVRTVSGLWPFLSSPKRRQIADAYAVRVAYRKSWPAGFKLPQQRLSDEEVGEIKALYAKRTHSAAAIAEQFGVSVWHVYSLNNGHSRRGR